MLLLLSADFSKLTSFRITIRVSNGLVPDQDRLSVGPDLGPNYLPSFISRHLKSPLARKELILILDNSLSFESNFFLDMSKGMLP